MLTVLHQRKISSIQSEMSKRKQIKKNFLPIDPLDLECNEWAQVCHMPYGGGGDNTDALKLLHRRNWRAAWSCCPIVKGEFDLYRSLHFPEVQLFRQDIWRPQLYSLTFHLNVDMNWTPS